jgi:glycogen debranching enzyme
MGNGAVHQPDLGPGRIDPHHPCQLVHHGYTVLVTREDGSIDSERFEGLYDYDTRILSRHVLTVSGTSPERPYATSLASDRWMSVMQVRLPGGTPAGPRLPQDQLSLLLTRRVGSGMHEELRLRNHAMVPWKGVVALELGADFADVQEAGGQRQQNGTIDIAWDPDGAVLTFHYQVRAGSRRLERGMRVRVRASEPGPSANGGSLELPVHLEAGGTWLLALEFESLVDGVWRRPISVPALGDRDDGQGQSRRFRTGLECPHPLLAIAFRRAADDLWALRNVDLETSSDAWILNAGVPSYTGLFGRDSLTASWQAALLGPEMMRGAIARIAELQATEDDPWRDAEPGKLVHEVRRGPLSELDIIPQRAYYGTQTTPAMFLLALSELWHWTGDLGFVARHKDTALRALEWARRFGDRDGDGFLEYVKRSPRGLKNQAWKDSDEAIRYPDGSMVENPIATVEEQAYYCVALQRMSELLFALGDDRRAEGFLEEARVLKRRWHEAFWVEEDGFYALALDPDKKPVRSIASNPGHALAAGLVPRERARQVADRLLAPDLFSGWGIRTLSAKHPSYNPLAYHLGTVWPVENATFVVGFKRYGLDEHLDRLVTAMFEAASYFVDCRLPEAYSGDGPSETAVPIPYPGACSPQAWSASATIQIVQMMLGLYPFAAAGVLALVRPRLPAFVPSLTLNDLRVGDATLSIRFERAADGRAHADVVARSGRVRLVEMPPPDEIERGAGAWTELKAWALEHAPGVTAREIRLALGHLDP